MRVKGQLCAINAKVRPGRNSNRKIFFGSEISTKDHNIPIEDPVCNISALYFSDTSNMNPTKVNNITVRRPNLLHLSAKPILIIVRCLGLFPVSGLFYSNQNKLKYKFRFPYCIICILSLMGHLFNSVLCVAYLFFKKASPRLYYKVFFNLGGTLLSFSTVRLAAHWPSLIREAALIEETLPKFHLKNVTLTCKIIAALVILLTAVEHALDINFYLQMGEACSSRKDIVDDYFRYTKPYAAYFLPYSPWLFALLVILHIQTLIIMNFSAVLIMSASLYLTSCFNEFNSLLLIYKDKYPNIWNVIRMQYTKLTRLVRLVDRHISPFVLLVFGLNLAVICIDFFKILRRNSAHDISGCDPQKITYLLASPDRAVYFAFTTSFIVLKTLMTAIFGSRLYTSARESINILYEVPSNCFSGETHRFLEQIHGNNVALSGLHFFYVTQQMILTMAATILTYELVLLQFADKI